MKNIDDEEEKEGDFMWVYILIAMAAVLCLIAFLKYKSNKKNDKYYHNFHLDIDDCFDHNNERIC